MIPARNAITRIQRDLIVGTALNVVLGISVVAAFVTGMGSGIGAAVVLTIIGAVWLGLSYQSIKGSRLAAGSGSLIAAGELDQAEHQIEQALRSFSLFRSAKLMSLHHLAVLRHAQKRWEDAAQLSRALLRQRLGPLRGLGRQSRLILADSLLQIGDLPAAQESIGALYSQRLTLAEALNLLGVQLDYQARIHAWDAMLAGVATKVQLAELMQSSTAARVQALLALAAKKSDKTELAEWLRRRVELLVDFTDLTKARPELWELWSSNQPLQEQAPSVST